MPEWVRLIIGMAGLCVVAACGDGGPSTPEPVQRPLLPAKGFTEPEINLADAQFETVHFSGSKTCATCHDEQATGEDRTMIDSMGRDLSIVKAWQSSMMANAARDPYWMAVVASEMDLYPHLRDELNDVCTRCHAPMANEVGRRTGNPLQLFDETHDGVDVPGFLSLDNTSEVFNHGMDGVSCSMCHQIADDGNLGTPAGMTGGFHIEEYSEDQIAERPAYGQYIDADVGYMKSQSNFTPVFGAHISTSEACATCHNLTTESVDTDGQPLAEPVHFPEQMAYSEWENSAFADDGSTPQSCQDCHMPVVQEAVPIAGAGAGGVTRQGFAEHTFLGANTVMMSILQEWRDELGIDPEVDFESAIIRNRQFLSTAAELVIESATREPGKLNLQVKVVNKSGHKLPTGYHSRRAFLHVVVTDSQGQTVYENGRVNEDGSIAGVIEDNDSEQYEQHYDTITEATQVQVYQAIMKNSDNELTHSLLNGAGYLKDNRLTPAGFNKHHVPDEVSVAGGASTDSDFNWGADTVNYEISTEATGPLNVLVELNYQPLSFGHLTALFTRSDKVEQIDTFRTLFDAATLKTESIAAVTTVVD